jgi:N-acetylglutamate synthase-like GNAT family acetyltransferase
MDADLPAVLALLDSAKLPTADIESVRKPQMWVLVERGAIAGAVALEHFGSEALLRSLVVAPEYRKRQFGRDLVARVEQSAAEDSIDRLVLLTETAAPFFRKLGYSVTDRHDVSDALKRSAEFRSLCPASATCMSKLLAQHLGK